MPRRIRNDEQLKKFTYECGCFIFVTMDLADSPPTHYHHGEFNAPRQENSRTSVQRFNPKSRA